MSYHERKTTENVALEEFHEAAHWFCVLCLHSMPKTALNRIITKKNYMFDNRVHIMHGNAREFVAKFFSSSCFLFGCQTNWIGCDAKIFQTCMCISYQHGNRISRKNNIF